MGIPIVINDALCKQKVPVRKHNDRGERRRNRFFARPFKHTPSAYHLRIQKKWNKRFGMQDSDVFYMTPHAAIMSSAAYDKFCKAVTHTKRCYQCDKPVEWLAPDSRCADCTRLVPGEL